MALVNDTDRIRGPSKHSRAVCLCVPLGDDPEYLRAQEHSLNVFPQSPPWEYFQNALGKLTRLEDLLARPRTRHRKYSSVHPPGCVRASRVIVARQRRNSVARLETGARYGLQQLPLRESCRGYSGPPETHAFRISHMISNNYTRTV